MIIIVSATTRVAPGAQAACWLSDGLNIRATGLVTVAWHLSPETSRLRGTSL
jgi:hypothetical protein